MHMALLNAVDLRLRAAEIVVTGEGAGAEALLAAARQLPALDRIVLHARSPEGCRGLIRRRRSQGGARRRPSSASAKAARCR